MALLKSIPSEVIDMMKKLLIIVLVVALIVFFIAGFTAAISVVLGAMCVTLGIIFSAPIAYKAKGNVAASKVVTDALKGELVKILTISCFFGRNIYFYNSNSTNFYNIRFSNSSNFFWYSNIKSRH